jgi:spore coat protein CotH
MHVHGYGILVVLVGVVLALVPLGAEAQKVGDAPKKSAGKKPTEASAELFKGGKVLKIDIHIDPKEMDALRREPRKYARATLKEGDNVYKNVGLHVKGAAGSFRGIDDKAGLTLNMDKFSDDNSLFHGMDKFHLANSLQDPSYLSELLCGELFRAVGVPASRVTHAIVFINGQRRGLYYLKEGYDKYFLKSHFKGSSGNLYDGGFLRDVDQPLQFLGGNEDVKNQADLKALVAAAREGDAKKRFEKLEKVLDADQFAAYMAMEVLTWDWDGYPMNRNNYRIYHDPKRDKVVFFPSGMDQMFGDPGGTIFPNFQGMVARAFVETPEGRTRYLNKMDEILKGKFNPQALNKRLDELQAQVQPALAMVDPGAARDFPNQVNRLRNSIKQRAQSVEAQLKQHLKK